MVNASTLGHLLSTAVAAVRCVEQNGATECLSGFCAFRGCDEGHEDADGDLSNGCERAIPTQVTTMISDTESGCTQTGSQSLWTFFVLFLSRIFVFQRSIAPVKNNEGCEKRSRRERYPLRMQHLISLFLICDYSCADTALNGGARIRTPVRCYHVRRLSNGAFSHSPS